MSNQVKLLKEVEGSMRKNSSGNQVKSNVKKAEGVAFRLQKDSAPLAMAIALAITAFNYIPVFAVEASTVATTAGNTKFSLEPDTSDHSKERQEIEKLLVNMLDDWNSHSLDKVMNFYADDYINNDGLDKKAVGSLTQDFWRTYPDAKSSSKTREIRVEGNFATIESRDMAQGSTAREMPEIHSKGDLMSISEGQLYLRKLGNDWKIIGDRIDYEEVRVAFGMAKTLNPSFSAPEQVKSGHQYSAKLDMTLPDGLSAVGSITSQPLEYPQPQPPDAWRPIDSTILERIMTTNTKNHNELLMATVGITDTHNALKGITFLTRRLNVVPVQEPSEETKTAKAAAHKDAKATEKAKSTETEKKDSGSASDTKKGADESKKNADESKKDSTDDKKDSSKSDDSDTKSTKPADNKDSSTDKDKSSSDKDSSKSTDSTQSSGTGSGSTTSKPDPNIKEEKFKPKTLPADIDPTKSNPLTNPTPDAPKAPAP